MTSPKAQPAPNGYKSDGTPSGSIEDTRDDMLNQFDANTTDLKDNLAYYDAERRPEAIGIAVPPEMQKLLACVGYPRLYVDSIAERLKLEGFRLNKPGASTGGKNGASSAPAKTPAPASSGSAPGQAPTGQADTSTQDPAEADLWDWWQANNLDVEAPLGNTEALLHGRAYVTIAAPDPAVDLFVDPTVPIIRVESASTLYAVIDPRTRQVTQAIRNIKSADGSKTIAATLYLPMRTVAWLKDDQGAWQVLQDIPHNLGVVPVVPLPNRRTLSDLNGKSEITPELRSITDAAGRILMNLQGAAELMGVPQRLLFGVKPQEIGVDPETGKSAYDAYMARILAFTDPEGKAFQFQAAELRNFVDALDALDKKAAAYTGLPPQYLSYSSQNPASAEAIKSSESRLVKKCESKTSIFGGAWEQVMRIAYAVMNGGMQNLPPEYYRMESIWTDPSTPTYAARADAAAKLYNGGNGLIPKERGRMDIGYSVEERLEMQEWDRQENAALQLAGFIAPGIPKPGGPADPGQPALQAKSAAQPTATKTASPQT